MTQTTTGVRAVLSHPTIYELSQRGVGAWRSRTLVVRDHVRPRPGMRVLDLGCGPGDVLRHLGDVEYVGVDVSPGYIARARERFGERATFLVGDASAVDLAPGSFDLALSIGVLHHLGDEEVRNLCAGAARLLRPGGRLVTVDPTFVEGQSRIARFLISRDRGRDVRPPGGYEALARSFFPEVRTTVRRDLLTIPYTHCVLECAIDPTTD